MILYRISELMLPTLIQRYNKLISFLIQFKIERLTEILQAVRYHIFMIVLLLFINFLKLSWIKKKCLFLRKMELLILRTGHFLYIGCLNIIIIIIIITMFYRNTCIQCKQHRLSLIRRRFCSIWSGSTLFAFVPFMGRWAYTHVNGLTYVLNYK